MTTRNVLFRLAGSGIVCILFAAVGQATVARAFVATGDSYTNAPAVQLLQPRSDYTRVWRTDRRARPGRLQNWIDDHPVKGMIVKTAATLAVLVAIQLLVQPSHSVIHAKSVSAQLQHGRHHAGTTARLKYSLIPSRRVSWTGSTNIRLRWSRDEDEDRCSPHDGVLPTGNQRQLANPVLALCT